MISKDMSEVDFNPNVAIARMLEAQENLNVRLEQMKRENEERIRSMEEQNHRQFERICELLRRDAALFKHHNVPEGRSACNIHQSCPPSTMPRPQNDFDLWQQATPTYLSTCNSDIRKNLTYSTNYGQNIQDNDTPRPKGDTQISRQLFDQRHTTLNNHFSSANPAPQMGTAAPQSTWAAPQMAVTPAQMSMAAPQVDTKTGTSLSNMNMSLQQAAAPQVAAPQVAAPQLVAPQVAAPQMTSTPVQMNTTALQVGTQSGTSSSNKYVPTQQMGFDQQAPQAAPQMVAPQIAAPQMGTAPLQTGMSAPHVGVPAPQVRFDHPLPPRHCPKEGSLIMVDDIIKTFECKGRFDDRETVAQYDFDVSVAPLAQQGFDPLDKHLEDMADLFMPRADYQTDLPSTSHSQNGYLSNSSLDEERSSPRRRRPRNKIRKPARFLD